MEEGGTIPKVLSAGTAKRALFSFFPFCFKGVSTTAVRLASAWLDGKQCGKAENREKRVEGAEAQFVGKEKKTDQKRVSFLWLVSCPVLCVV